MSAKKNKNNGTLPRARLVAAALLGMGAAAGRGWADTDRDGDGRRHDDGDDGHHGDHDGR